MRSCLKHVTNSLLILCSAGCIDPVPLTPNDYRENIVIEGFLSSENSVQRVSISKTSAINEQSFTPESGATVWIEDGEANAIKFPENLPGRYEQFIAGIPGQSYVLHVTLHDSRQYKSSQVVLRNTPPVKQISAVYKPQQPSGDAGIYFSVDASDSTGQTRYYRWEFQETYEIQTPFPSAFEWLGGNSVQPRTIPVNRCWASDTSRNILIATSYGLADDQIMDFPIHFIPDYSYAMRIKYSLLVKQFSMTAEIFKYWKLLKQINQSQGSLFDIQPGTIIGNIQNVNDNKETVLGYFDASTVRYRRAFFTPSNFNSSGYKAPGYLTSCENLIPYDVPANQIGAFMSKTGNQSNLLISEATGSYEATLILRPKYCCDCTSLGTNIKPSYWH